MEPLLAPPMRCEVCDLTLETGEDRCRNPVCRFSKDRWFTWNFAVAVRSGALKEAINKYKYHGLRGWGIIFGRILAGFLEERLPTFESFDLIVASPTWTGAGGRAFHHTGEVLARAASEVGPGGSWPFDDVADPVIVKTSGTPAFVGRSFRDRRAIAEGELRTALRVAHPERVQGRQVLVYDDVFTDGLTLREVARALITQGGARLVCGVTLCRQPWREDRGGGQSR